MALTCPLSSLFFSLFFITFIYLSEKVKQKIITIDCHLFLLEFVIFDCMDMIIC